MGQLLKFNLYSEKLNGRKVKQIPEKIDKLRKLVWNIANNDYNDFLKLDTKFLNYDKSYLPFQELTDKLLEVAIELFKDYTLDTILIYQNTDNILFMTNEFCKWFTYNDINELLNFTEWLDLFIKNNKNKLNLIKE